MEVDTSQSISQLTAFYHLPSAFSSDSQILIFYCLQRERERERERWEQHWLDQLLSISISVSVSVFDCQSDKCLLLTTVEGDCQYRQDKSELNDTVTGLQWADRCHDISHRLSCLWWWLCCGLQTHQNISIFCSVFVTQSDNDGRLSCYTSCLRGVDNENQMSSGVCIHSSGVLVEREGAQSAKAASISDLCSSQSVS